MLYEGRWNRKIEEKDRFPIPAKIRSKFGTRGVWAIEPTGHVILCPPNLWKKMLRGAEDLQQFRISWQPFENNIDGQGRATIPPHLRERFGQELTVVSIGNYLKILPKNGNKQPTSESPETEPFQDEQEAARCFHEDREVVYLSHGIGEVVGKFRGHSGSFFSFTGRDPHDVIVSVRQVPYWNFRPKEVLKKPAAIAD